MQGGSAKALSSWMMMVVVVVVGDYDICARSSKSRLRERRRNNYQMETR